MTYGIARQRCAGAHTTRNTRARAQPWERDFCGGPLLDQQLAVGVEQEHAKRAVQHARMDVVVQVG